MIHFKGGDTVKREGAVIIATSGRANTHPRREGNGIPIRVNYLTSSLHLVARGGRVDDDEWFDLLHDKHGRMRDRMLAVRDAR